LVGPTPRPEVALLRPYVPGRPIREVQEAYGLTEVVKLASNENSLGPSPLAVRAIQQAALESHLYPESTAPLLQEALAHKLGVDSGWVLVGNGSDSLIRLLCLAYMQSGDPVVVPGCSFPSYKNFAATAGAQIIEVPLRDETMDLQRMAEAAEGARAVFLCRPNNPTGAVFPEEPFRTFLDHVDPTTLVVIDEAYIEYDSSPFDSLGLLRAHPNLVLLRTFSKIYGLGGVRVGYGIAHPYIWQPCLTVREPFGISSLAQAAARAALADVDHISRSLRVNRDGKAFLQATCDVLGLRYAPSEANFLFIDLGRPAAPVFEALMKQGVIVRPIGERPTCVRVTIGTPQENQRFAEALRAVLGA
jgi:histidinol-phosphate aminotransferase